MATLLPTDVAHLTISTASGETFDRDMPALNAGGYIEHIRTHGLWIVADGETEWHRVDAVHCDLDLEPRYAFGGTVRR